MLETLGLHYESNILTTIGLLVAAAFLGSKAFQRFGIPQVVGFIVMGVLMGNSFLNLVPLELAEELTFVSEVAPWASSGLTWAATSCSGNCDGWGGASSSSCSLRPWALSPWSPGASSC